MWTTINKKLIKVKLSTVLENSILSDPPTGMDYNKDAQEITVEFSDEGFDASDWEKYLRCAVKKGSILIHIEDHKGDDTYKIHYGPGFYDEE